MFMDVQREKVQNTTAPRPQAYEGKQTKCNDSGEIHNPGIVFGAVYPSEYQRQQFLENVRVECLESTWRQLKVVTRAAPCASDDHRQFPGDLIVDKQLGHIDKK